MPSPSRRDLLAGALASLPLHWASLGAAGLLAGCGDDRPAQTPLVPGEGPFAGGVYLGDVPFLDVRERVLGALDGDGLDGRRRIDLAALTPATLLTPPGAFYVRTREPDLPDAWPISVDGLVATPTTLAAAGVAAAATDQGTHLMECSGNGKGECFGLMSVTTWAGVPLLDVLGEAGARREGTRVLVRGLDHAGKSPNGSFPGCSWVFGWADLAATGAFLATHMGGAPLTAVHGAPVRLVVPGWFGCCSVKWVDRIEVVADDTPSTPHMREFATRTHQVDKPPLARDFTPATLELAALPIRVEEWRVDGRARYRVWGIVWGGARPAGALEFRSGKKERWQAVTAYVPPTDNRAWTLWWHDWEPTESGEHTLQVRSPDKGLAQRRIEKGWYKRKVAV
ncbi:MAG: molybdopterin-dependent oxidoreductase [Pseudomonadota bacterium]|nr:molybdopterin-dependent oxidoreductase [Pseudomonadota bacterium]